MFQHLYGIPATTVVLQATSAPGGDWIQYGALGLLGLNLVIDHIERRDERRTRSEEAKATLAALELARAVQAEHARRAG